METLVYVAVSALLAWNVILSVSMAMMKHRMTALRIEMGRLKSGRD